MSASPKGYAWKPRDGHPGHETYLLNRVQIDGMAKLELAQAHGAYKTLGKVLRILEPADVTQFVKDSGLRGRGGAGFPTALKFTFMPKADDPRPRYLAVNADESEPGTCKDRVLLRRDPHLLIEGVLLACYAMQCSAAYVFMRGEYVTEAFALQDAICEAYEEGLLGPNILGSSFSCDMHLTRGAGAYICGEETALMEALEGRRGHPRPKPPFPAVSGLWGQPTTVNNVETLCNIAPILEHGMLDASPVWYKSMGSEKSPGNILCGVSGHVKQPGIFEVPLGISLRELIEAPAYGGGILGDRALKAFLPGGSSSGFLPAKDVDVLLTHDDLQAKGSMLGTASVIVLDESADIVRSTRIITDFYHDESCGQCTQCREGSAWLAAILRRIENGDGQSGDIDSMLELCANMKGKTICVLSDACAWPIELAIKHFRQDFEDAIRGARSTVAFTDGAITDRAFTDAAARGAQSPGAVTPGAGE